jgi:ferritin-like metal-binding protein YciE
LPLNVSRANASSRPLFTAQQQKQKNTNGWSSATARDWPESQVTITSEELLLSENVLRTNGRPTRGTELACEPRRSAQQRNINMQASSVMATSETARSIYVTGLVNAHALENQALAIMQRQVERLEHYPEVSKMLRQHIAETNTQIGRLDQLLGSLGESASSVKDTVTSFIGNLSALAHAPMQDEILKNTFANYAFENYEIASYNSLMVMAEASGHQDSIGLLRQSLNEEERMAAWIRDHVRDVTLKYMDREKRGVNA